eukprot:TRINITY_DN612_c0_g1_i3.p4 TRINITY_DN612_c0_g1~~TRINITY_DN612_c0_g1_i3.p4  ORF type:complete len:101 (+),score=38.85 TRINITY_DN612_c0_g1_i3:46-303(+)
MLRSLVGSEMCIRDSMYACLLLVCMCRVVLAPMEPVTSLLSCCLLDVTCVHVLLVAGCHTTLWQLWVVLCWWFWVVSGLLGVGRR